MTTPLSSGAAPAGALVVIGASTGGPRILPDLVQALSRLPVCLVIVQHMPKYINASLVRTLSRSSPGLVKLAESGDRVAVGRTFVAPSEVHCTLLNNRTFSLLPGPAVNYVCPAIDVTMQSLRPGDPDFAHIGILLTGMGKDGAAGLAHMKQIGALTIAQSQATCAVYGMPAEAVKLGCVDHVLPPSEIGRLVSRYLS